MPGVAWIIKPQTNIFVMNPVYRQARFTVGAASLAQLPPDTGLEIAFAGRSNAGKSSAINTITNVRALARISKTPGRTQQINCFSLDNQRRLIDLPGYGYAKVPLHIKHQWQQLIGQYLQSRKSLKGLVIVMDCRHPLTSGDQQLLHWCHQANMPVHLLLTKADKLSRGAAGATLQSVKKTLANEFGNTENWATTQLFSSLKKTGVEQVHARLDDLLGYLSDAESAG